MAELKLTRGYNLRLTGEAAPDVADAPYPARVALKPTEMRGIKPRLLVAVGDAVKAGSPLFHDKADERYRFAAPVSGKVAAINRGRRRVIESIVIETDGDKQAEDFRTFSTDDIRSAAREELVAHLMQTGMLAVFRQRPFDRIADPNVVPRDIFIPSFDSGPLAPDTAVLLRGNEAAFQAGLALCSRLTGGRVHLCIDGTRTDLPTALTGADGVDIHRVSGPHPAGCVGVQVHHIAPIRGRDDAIWYATVQGLILLGRLLVTGKLDASLIVAVTGAGATERKYFRTVLGAGIESLVQDHVVDGELRYISGNVLTGRTAGRAGFVGFWDHMITVIPEAVDPELAGWMLPGFDRESSYRSFVSGFLSGKRFNADTRLHGGRRAFVATGVYERVLPMDIMPVYLMKSIMAEDFDDMEGLGIYELCEEEIALCEYVCPSKIEFQQILRQGLDFIEKEG